MIYRVKITNSALMQLKEIVEYISEVLFAPDTARRWSDLIQAEIRSLQELPLRYPLVNEEPWRSEGVHKMSVKNFIVYYWVDEDACTVWVTAVVYGKRDQISALRVMPKE